MTSVRRMRGTVLALVLALASTAAIAQKLPADMARAERDFRAQMQLGNYPTVRYQDETGQPIGFAEFLDRAANGMEYGVSRNATVHIATVRLRKPRAPGEKIVVRPGPWRGMDVPEFKGTTLDGERVDNAGFAGRWTIISFYFASCGPCIKEVPALNAFQQAHPDVRVLSVTFETAAEGRAFVARHGLRTPVVPGQQAFIDAMGVAGYPNVALIGPEGTVVSLFYLHNRNLAMARAREQLARQGGTRSVTVRPPEISAEGMAEWVAMARQGRAADAPLPQSAR